MRASHVYITFLRAYRIPGTADRHPPLYAAGEVVAWPRRTRTAAAFIREGYARYATAPEQAAAKAKERKP